MSEPVVISVYTTEEQKAEIERWAEEEDRSVSGLLRRIIDAALEARREVKAKEERA